MKTVMIENYFLSKLEELKEKGLYNKIDILEGPNSAYITIKAKKLLNFSSNNYLGLANDERIKQAAKKAIDKYGVGAGAVRTINGTLQIHKELEKTIAKFKGTESAIVFQSGFNANLGTIPAILTKKDAVISDELNHASIISGLKLSGAKIFKVKHQDMKDFEKVAKEISKTYQYEKILYISDGVFSMDGDIANLPEIVRIAKKYNIITYIDDAHGSGVMGKGAGTVKHFNLQKTVDIQMGTLSKAVGVIGGYIAGSKTLIKWLKLRARTFLFSTSITPASTGAAKKAIEIIMEGPEIVEKLWENAKYLKNNLKKQGFNIGNSNTPIIPVIIGNEILTQQFSNELFKEGIYAKAIVFPTVPKGTGRIRNMISSIHTKEMLDELLKAYKKIGKKLKINN